MSSASTVDPLSNFSENLIQFESCFTYHYSQILNSVDIKAHHRMFQNVSMEGMCCLFFFLSHQVKCNSKKVLLRERKRHTARRVVLGGGGTYLVQGGTYLGGGGGGYLPWQGRTHLGEGRYPLVDGHTCGNITFPHSVGNAGGKKRLISS